MGHNTPQFLYIMGRGHSGSTVLDALLGSGKNLQSVGEIVSGMPRTEDLCSCGEKIKNCYFWNAVKKKFEEESDYSWNQATEQIVEQAHIKSFYKTWRGHNANDINRLKEINQTLFKSISAVSGNKVVVDSSKEFTRGLFLAKYTANGKIIHLIRNPLAILASNLLRIKEGKFKILRYTFKARKTAFPFICLSAAGWLIGNALGELVGLVERGKVLRVRYEDLCEYPSRELKRIEAFSGHDLTDVIKSIEESKEIKIEHMIAGNRMRNNGSFVFSPSRKSHRKLPLQHSLLGVLITWPFMLKYGYLTQRLQHSISKLKTHTTRREIETKQPAFSEVPVSSK